MPGSVANNKMPRHDRLSYATPNEQEAFNDGWDDRSSLVLISDMFDDSPE
jgi:hypothetical protein